MELLSQIDSCLLLQHNIDGVDEKGPWSGSIRVGDFKLLLGPQAYAYWQGPDFPVRAP